MPPRTKKCKCLSMEVTYEHDIGCSTVCVDCGKTSFFVRTTTKRGRDRLPNNLAILKKLTKLVKDNPDLRFGQILSNYADSPGFYTESSDTLLALSSNEVRTRSEDLQLDKQKT
jgi:hypothetical protein